MIDAKSFIYLSRGQKLWISAAIGLSIGLSIMLILSAKYVMLDQEMKILGIDLLKMGLTALAAWTFIVLYGSSNSYERIAKETDKFLKVDILRAARNHAEAVGSHDRDPLHDQMKLTTVVRTKSSVIYQFSARNADPIHFYCKLTLSELILLFYLPADHHDDREKIYALPINFYEQNNIQYTFAGVKNALWLDNTPKLEMRVVRPIAPNFLFNAAARVDLCEKIIGDALAHLDCANSTAPRT